MVKAVISWGIALWACKVFLFSLPYKFTRHPDTQHIFGTIGQWIGDLINPGLGQFFSNFGSYFVGGFELLTSMILLLPALIWAVRKSSGGFVDGVRARWHAIGGLMAAAVMAGAVFFHLATPLGIEVLHEGKSDGGSLFYAAVSILVLGIAMFVINFSALRTASADVHAN